MSTPADTHDHDVRFLDVGQTALALGVSGATVRRWVRAGHLKAAQPAGREGILRIPATELERLAHGDTR